MAVARHSAGAWQEPPIDRSQTISLDVTRVNILFTVADKKGRFVNNLLKQDLEILELKKKQTILEFTAESELPLRIAILVDTSNSIRARFRFEIEAARAFLESVIRKGRDKALVYSFDTDAELIQDFTDDTELLGNKLRDLRPGGGTALYDAIYAACRDRMMLDRPMHNFRRAMIIIGDGEDNASRLTRDQAMEYNNSGTLRDQTAERMPHQPSDGDKVLQYLTKETGGLTYYPFRAQDLEQDFENIANELRSQYSILFRPEPLKTDGRYHPVEVRIPRRGDLVVRARKGDYAPKEELSPFQG